MDESRARECLRVDAHVHMHACFDQRRFLDAAAANLGVGPSAAGRVSGVLCLTETSDAAWFEGICLEISRSGASRGHWRFDTVEEPMTVLATDQANRSIAIIAGRQIVTGEGLEVLGLGLAELIDDGRPTREVLTATRDAGALPVLPWGFGKWTARRGRLVRELIADPPCEFWLGDNGGRLSRMAEPPEFATGRERGMAILPGTDPFPFPWDVGRVGSYGLEFDGDLDARRPFTGLKALLDDPDRRPRAYGRLEGLPGFVRNQFAIQVRKWWRKLRP